MWLLMLITWAFLPPPLTFSFPQGSAAQEPIVRSARSMLDSSTYLLETARSLVLNPKDPPSWSILAGHSRTVSDSIKSLITSIRLVLTQPTAASVSAGLSWIEVYNSFLTVGKKKGKCSWGQRAYSGPSVQQSNKLAYYFLSSEIPTGL